MTKMAYGTYATYGTYGIIGTRNYRNFLVRLLPGISEADAHRRRGSLARAWVGEN